MDGVLLAEGAVLVQLELVRGVLLVLHRVVVSLLALVASERDLNAHLTAPPYLLSSKQIGTGDCLPAFKLKGRFSLRAEKQMRAKRKPSFTGKYDDNTSSIRPSSTFCTILQKNLQFSCSFPLFFTPCSALAKQIRPSARGELEITSLNELYLAQKRLKCELMGRGFAWLDTGTHDSLLEASSFIQTLQKRQNLKIACLEEIAFLNGWIDEGKLRELGEKLDKNDYGAYLITLANAKPTQHFLTQTKT